MLTVQVLLSCMYQQDCSIIEHSNLSKIPTLVINQMDVFKEEKKFISEYLLWINTPTRGLSVSRNLAIKNSEADICLLADDDEIFEENLVQKISSAYDEYPQADIILFNVNNFPIKFGDKVRPLKKWEILKANSIRITFRLKKIQDKVCFDTLLGSGTENGGGEENKFLLDCWKQGFKIYFVPVSIATLNKQSSSSWFYTFDENYFYTRGKATRYILGFWYACIYGIYFLVTKYSQYRKNCSIYKAILFLFKGIVKGIKKTNVYYRKIN
ncbi:glycosyltransferase [Candidatus Ruminimicrobium bovinum]|uniref:glycosyltransferase family A protein n=1 Tax=Candidatus Ruminimicrobium bovinum TaxID=3242779 RepID=UPI0039B98E6F